MHFRKLGVARSPWFTLEPGGRQHRWLTSGSAPDRRRDSLKYMLIYRLTPHVLIRTIPYFFETISCAPLKFLMPHNSTPDQSLGFTVDHDNATNGAP